MYDTSSKADNSRADRQLPFVCFFRYFSRMKDRKRSEAGSAASATGYDPLANTKFCRDDMYIRQTDSFKDISNSLEATLTQFPELGETIFEGNDILATYVLQNANGDVTALPIKVQAALLNQGKTIKNLDLSYLQVTTDTLEKIVRIFPNIECINLECSNITDRELSVLKALTKLESLDVGATKITGESLVLFPGLKELNIGNCFKLSDAALTRSFARLAKLERLYAARTTLSGENLKYIEPSCLIELYFFGCKFDKHNENALAEILKEANHLEILNVGATRITDAGLRYVPQSLKQLDCQSCHHLTDEGLGQALQQAKLLKELDARSNNFNGSALQFASRDLEKLDFGVCKNFTYSDLLKFLDQAPKLIFLRVHSKTLGEGSQELASLQKERPTLEIDIFDND